MHYGIGSGAGGGKSECAIPDGVTSILDGAFTGSSLRDLTIPGSVAFIEDDLFQDFTDLNSVTLLEGITGIGWDAFYNCHKLTRVVLPSTLEEIGDWAFHDCYSLEEVRYSGTDEQKAKMYIGEGNDYLTKLNWLYWLNHDHPYGDWFYSPEPTLYSDGMERRECKICEAFEKRAVPMLDVPAPAITVSAKSKTGEPVLKWESVDANCSYVIYRSTSKSSGFEYLTVTYKNTFTDSAAKIGTKYYYKGLTRLQDRESAFSDTVSPFVKLGKPAVTVSSTASTNGKPEIRWEDVPGAAKCYVYRSQEKSSGYTRVGSSTGTSYRDDSAVPGGKYFYKVKAIHSNASANSPYSSVKYITAK